MLQAGRYRLQRGNRKLHLYISQAYATTCIDCGIMMTIWWFCQQIEEAEESLISQGVSRG